MVAPCPETFKVHNNECKYLEILNTLSSLYQKCVLVLVMNFSDHGIISWHSRGAFETTFLLDRTNVNVNRSRCSQSKCTAFKALRI